MLGYINRRSLHISKRENCTTGLEIILVIICSLQIRTHIHTRTRILIHTSGSIYWVLISV